MAFKKNEEKSVKEVNQIGKRRVIWNRASFTSIILIYIAIVILVGIYFIAMQGFGSKGLTFNIEGKDQVFTVFDAVLLIATIISLFLVIISLIAFKRKKDNRIFILAIAFFLFAIQEISSIFATFFPGEYIFIENAAKLLDLLILVSFAMLVYGKFNSKG